MSLINIAVFVMAICSLYCEGKSKSLNVLTFNTELHESDTEAVQTKAARRKNIIKTLKASSADVVCLQEVSIGEDMESIVGGVKSVFPYSFSELHTDVSSFPSQAQGTRQPPCIGTSRLESFEDCLETNGCNAITDYKDNAECALEYCGLRAYTIYQLEAQDCISCISSSWWNLGKCTDTQEVVGGRAINKGGLVLLSKKELNAVSYTDLHPLTKETLTRGYIEAEIKDFAPVVCTHLSNTKTKVYFEPDFTNSGVTSYKEWHTDEVDALITRLSGVRPAILLGRMNTGYTRIKKNYKKLLKEFKTKQAYTDKTRTSILLSSDLDHVFVKGLSIIWTKSVYFPKSDHAGVQSKLKLKI